MLMPSFAGGDPAHASGAASVGNFGGRGVQPDLQNEEGGKSQSHRGNKAGTPGSARGQRGDYVAAVARGRDNML